MRFPLREAGGVAFVISLCHLVFMIGLEVCLFG